MLQVVKPAAVAVDVVKRMGENAVVHVAAPRGVWLM